MAIDRSTLEIPRTIDGWHYYCQWDPAWADKPYTVTNDPTQTVGSSACLPTVQAIVLRNLGVSSTMTPDFMADWNVTNGFRTPDTGTKHASWDAYAEEYKLRHTTLESDAAVMSDALAVGGFVVASLHTPGRNSLGRLSGHIVAIHAVKDGRFKALDPDSIENSRQWWPVDEVIPYIHGRARHLQI